MDLYLPVPSACSNSPLEGDASPQVLQGQSTSDCTLLASIAMVLGGSVPIQQIMFMYFFIGCKCVHNFVAIVLQVFGIFYFLLCYFLNLK